MQVNKSRVETLSDGVFAIAMTILILNIHVPDIPQTTSGVALFAALMGTIPALASYIISFIVLSMYWTTHHAFFHSFLRTINAPLMQINMIFLMLICIIPFSTELLGKFPANEAAFAVYAVNVVALGLIAFGMFRYAHRAKGVEHYPLTHHADVQSGVRTMLTPIGALLALIVMRFSFPLAYIVVILPSLFNFFPKSLRKCEDLIGIQIKD